MTPIPFVHVTICDLHKTGLYWYCQFVLLNALLSGLGTDDYLTSQFSDTKRGDCTCGFEVCILRSLPVFLHEDSLMMMIMIIFNSRLEAKKNKKT